MSFSIQTNVNSLIAQENLRVNTNFQSQTIQRLTSGYRINSSGDDAAGLAVANKFRSDVTELTQGVRNANDGMSQLQIIDGGLSNISKMLDRMKTLATQSSSSTFTGDRTTLQTEYDKLKTEINRQAANIGLGTGSTEAARYNISMNIYTGGGATQTQASVTINLSDTADKVDATSLGLSGSIDSTSTATTLVDGTFTGSTKYLDKDSTQTFHFKTADKSFDVTVKGGTAGVEASDIVQQLNDGLIGSGISVFVDDDGNLAVNSPNAFAVTIDTRSGTGAAVAASSVDSDEAITNAGMNVWSGGALSDVTGDGAGAGVITFSEGSNTYNVNIAEGDTKDDVYNALSAALKDSDIKVLRFGDNVYLESTKTFTGTYTGDAADAAGGGLENLGDGVAWDAANDYAASTAPTDKTTNGKAALLEIADAVDKLSAVQGKVGAGQNMLGYAISLAQSQITNYSSAESRIRDADVASEAANLTKAQVLQQASIAAMAQANSAPQAVLTLLRG